MKEFMDRLLNIQVADPDDSRRRRLLNILLVGMFFSGFLGVIFVMGLLIFSPGSLNRPGNQLILPSALIFMIGTAAIYFVNRRTGRWAAFLFLLLLTIALSISDTPIEVSSGRSLFFFAFPIAISSLVLFPGASFIFAAISTGIITKLALSSSLLPNGPAIIGFFMLALVSWLASRGLEQALGDLRTTNANLDKMVFDRTQALAASLARERAQAGQREAILNSIADGVIVFDTVQTSILANPAIEGLLDTPVDQIVNKTFDNLVQSPNLSPRDRGLLQTMIDTKTQPSSFRVEWGKKSLSVSAAQVYDTANEDIGTVAVFRDVTHEAELERMKSSFLAIVSHELRTPLNAIIGFAEMLVEAVYGPVNDKQAAASKRILRNGQHMLGMVGDLLDEAQIEAGKLRITAEPFKPAELLNNIQEVMDQIVAEKGLTLTGELDPRLPGTIKGDQHRLQQILMNLVNNAAKFTEAGSIHIRLFLAKPKQWGLEVTDTGSGIPDEELLHIFDAFHQVDTTTTRQQGGFGLGLSIVKQLVLLMEGEINTRSTLGGGSTFTILLPLAEEALERKPAMNQTALIIEDDGDLAAIFAEALKSAGFEPEVIRDGAIAEKRIKEVVPQIVILDLHLPHIDGPTLLAQIRADATLKATIVIVATADALMGKRFNDSADIVLIKPISFVQLRDLSARLRVFQSGLGL
jgi:PAS domain S-box-containing protein